MWLYFLISVVVAACVVFLSRPKRDNNADEKEIQLQTGIQPKNNSYFDVVIVGGGLSGISAAQALAVNCPNKSFILLERRNNIGGTWDLFRYPGIRSDSDMYTLGYTHTPWTKSEPIAQGQKIQDYIKSVAKSHGIDGKISYQKQLISADFCSEKAEWTLTIRDYSNGDETLTIKCNVLEMCSGYYDYDNPYKPKFEGAENFRGDVIHPQEWPENYDYSGKKIIIIGSGATAVTLLPNLTDAAERVTMLQRSPSYVLNLPQRNRLRTLLQTYLPAKVAYQIIRWQNITIGWLLFTICRAYPTFMKKRLMKATKKQLPSDFDCEKHFSPSYNPWEQRLCLSPDGDIFKSIRDGKADVVTDHIEKFVPEGILLKSGNTIEADLIITATGLNIKFFGGAIIKVDGAEVTFSEKFLYRGMMMDNLPNLFYYAGYTNASWTLKCEITSGWSSRVLNYADKVHAKKFYPFLKPGHTMKRKQFLNLTSGYLTRAKDLLPALGDTGPWSRHSFMADIWDYYTGDVNDGVLNFD